MSRRARNAEASFYAGGDGVLADAEPSVWGDLGCNNVEPLAICGAGAPEKRRPGRGRAS